MTEPLRRPEDSSQLDLLRCEDSLPVEGSAFTLGSIRYGRETVADSAAPHLSVTAPALLAGQAYRDQLLLSQPTSIHRGRTGAVDWNHDEQWLFGVHDPMALAPDDSLEPASFESYRQVFDTLRETGFPHLLRVWNYLPDINRPVDGLERYRQFNIGRQRAFVEADESIGEGAPAACALGSADARLRIAFLAGRRPALPVENPRQVPAYHYPDTYGPRSPTFSRGVLVDAGGGRAVLLISGTASIVGHATRHAGDVCAQTRETLDNLQALLDATLARTGRAFVLDDLHLTVYVRHAGDVAQVRDTLAQRLAPTATALRTLVMLQADVCRDDLLVEIEAHATAPGVPLP